MPGTYSIPTALVDTLTSDPDSWKGCSLLSVTQITPSGLDLLRKVSQHMATMVRDKGGCHEFGNSEKRHFILATVFFEASTRTSCSFQAAMQRLGGSTIHVDSQTSSSGQKGETLADTIRCLESYVDIMVLRHPIRGSVGEIISYAKKPVINAGDGTGEHPTQALLDWYTICEEVRHATPQSIMSPKNGCHPKLVVVLLGDLKHGRTVHSLAVLLARSGIDVVLRYCAPSALAMPEYIHDYVEKYNVRQETISNLEEAIQGAHVLYVTRIQKERFENLDDYNALKVHFEN
jgi:aspartate carbamoyltransferase